MAAAAGEIHFRTILLWHSQGRRKGDPTHKCCGKNRVGFGRAELSLRLPGIFFCALSSGHGPRVLGFQGGSSWVDFHSHNIYVLGLLFFVPANATAE